MKLEDMVKVMQQFQAGKVLEQRRKVEGGKWKETTMPLWDFQTYDYRIRSEPKSIYVVEYQDLADMFNTYRLFHTAKGVFDFCDKFNISHANVTKYVEDKI